MTRLLWRVVAAATLGWSASAIAADDPAAKAIYESGCIGCHGTGVLGAPKLGDTAAWAPRVAAGLQAVVNAARAGKGSMPPKGGNMALTEAQLLSVVSYMVAQSGGVPAAAVKAAAPAQAVKAAAPAAPPIKAAAAKPAPTPAVASAAPAAPSAAPAPAVASAPPPPPATAPTPAPAVVPVALPVAAAPGVNSFNRLLRPAQRNRPPAEDGIHDPGNEGTLALQAPLAAFTELPRSNAGNRVDWVKSLSQGKIAPRADRVDANAVPAVMDLNIVREVKGSMPDVVYPHKQHTEWLDCSNCHPAIFKPQKGANQISMAAILLGEACGVCHGKVAFPVSECRLCHSKSKPAGTTVAAPAPAPAAPR